MPHTLRVYTTEEVDLLLNGDRREVDRLLIHGINNVAAVLIPHIQAEERVFEALGDVETVRLRSAWTEAQIKKQEKRNAMMQKVSESAMAWAFIAFLGFLAVVTWEGVVDTIRTHKAVSGK